MDGLGMRKRKELPSNFATMISQNCLLHIPLAMLWIRAFAGVGGGVLSKTDWWLPVLLVLLDDRISDFYTQFTRWECERIAFLLQFSPIPLKSPTHSSFGLASVEWRCRWGSWLERVELEFLCSPHRWLTQAWQLVSQVWPQPEISMENLDFLRCPLT